MDSISVSKVSAGQVTILAQSGAVEADTRVTITNARTQEVVDILADAMGAFTAAINASAGDSLSIAVSDAAGNYSEAVQLKVPGAAGDLLPDPATVAPPVDRTVVTTLVSAAAFLYSGENAIQTGVAPGTIEPRRIAVLRGKVSTLDGDALSGAKVTVHGHPEFGHTLSREDGMFDLAVNGGGVITLNYSKAGYLVAQRKVSTRWQDYVWSPDVVLIPYDQKATRVDLAPGAPMQVAEGSHVTDADGTRHALLLFQEGTTATILLPDGSVEPLTTLNVRATEFTVGPNGAKAMPAELPASSGYTYAVELSADEAESKGALSVQFSQPVIQYVENFLNFPVGGIVPAGYYDRAKAAWIPSDNGRVVKVLSISNGLAYLDVAGGGQPADATELLALGITDAERQKLASLYQPNTSLWRVPVKHFTPWDYNWPYGPPDDAQNPGQREPQSDKKESDPCKEKGSVIECQNQVLGEVVDVAGTPFRLHYQSDRVPGHKASSSITIPLSGASIPASLKRIELRIETAGRRFAQTFPAEANQKYVFTWDGYDAYGRRIQGRQPVTTHVGYVYEAVYLEPSELAGSFARFSPSSTEINRARREITLWQDNTVSTPGGGGIIDAPSLGLGGWTVDVHHAYDPLGRQLHLGSGEVRNAENVSRVLTRVAGGGLYGYWDTPGPALNLNLSTLAQIDVAPDGSIYIAEGGSYRPSIRRVTPDGIATVVAGGNFFSWQLNRGNGGPAIDADMHYPQDVAVAEDGSFYIVEGGGVRRVGVDGIIDHFAGASIGNCQYEGGAKTVCINAQDVEIGPDGSVYIGGSGRIVKVDADGTATTVAGNNEYPYDPRHGEGGPATQAAIRVSGFAVANDGALYIATGDAVRRVGVDGIITTIAGGNGNSGTSGDGGPAKDAGVSALDVVIGENELYLREYYGRVRRIRPDGIISTIAGGGQYTLGYIPDSIPATSLHLFDVRAMAAGPDGLLYIGHNSSWNYNGRVSRISPVMPGFEGSDVVIPSEDGGQLFVFDPNGRHLRTVNALTGGLRYRFGYDSNGLLTSVEDGDGNKTLIARSGSEVQITAPHGQKTALGLGSDGYAAIITNPANEKTSVDYSADGLLTLFTDARGNASRMTYDSLGRLVKDENAAGGSWTLARIEQENGNLMTLTSAEGRQVSYHTEYLPVGARQWTNTASDGTQYVTLFNNAGGKKTTTPDGTLFETVETPDIRFGMQAPVLQTARTTLPSGLKSIVDNQRIVYLSNLTNPLSVSEVIDYVTVNGRRYQSHYRADTKQFVETSPVGRQQKTTIDARGRPTLNQVGNLASSSYVYDAKGRLEAIIQSDATTARTTSIAYNPEGYVSGITDALGRSVGYSYDRVGRLIQQTLPDGRVVSFTYDGNGNVTSVTPPGRPGHSFTYTAVDLTAEYVPPDLGAGDAATRYAYNLDKQVTKITRPDDQPANLSYDSAGRLSSIKIPSGQTNFAYGATGQLASINTADGIAMSYAYDGFLPLSESWAGPITGTVSRTYNSDFRVTSLAVNGISMPFGYDADGLVIKAGDQTLAYDAQNGLLTGTTLGNVDTSQAYNAFGEITNSAATHSGNPVLATQYTRDTLGRITHKMETVFGETHSFAYGYDQAGRLSAVTRDGVAVAEYDYDANGNRIGGFSTDGPISAAVDAQDRLLAYGTNTYSYTANGELTTKTSATGGTVSYSYDVLGNLRSVALPNGATIEYLIDGSNRRVGKKVNGAFVQGWLYQDNLNPVAELDARGNITARFIYASRSNVPDYVIKGANSYRIISDHLGSPRLVINTLDGTVAQRLDYDEFGNVTWDSNPGFQPFGFAGGLYDKDTKLVRFGARDYDPETGRWTSKDPIRFNGRDSNLFGYAQNDPVNWIDPDGRFAFVIPALPAIGEGLLTIGTGIAIGLGASTPVTQQINQPIQATGLPPGFWPGDKGAEEWGRRDGCGAKEGRRRFHQGVKQSDNMSGARDKYGINPSTGDVVDPEGEIVGNLNDV